MRPTREGRITPQRAGLVYSGIGIDPDVVTTDPEPPTDRAALGQAYVPFLVTGSAALVQSDDVLGVGFVAVTLTLPNAPTVGNMLVICAGMVNDNDPTFSLSNGTWTQVNSTVYSSASDNHPNRAYYQIVTSSTSASTTITPTGGSPQTGAVKAAILELSGVDSLDADIEAISNSSTTSGSITPAAGLPAVLVSGTLALNNPGSVAPAGSMTELYQVGGTGRPLGVNYQEVASTAGAYTVGSTGASANSSMIGFALVDTGESIVWISAPETIDGDDATYDYAYDTGIEQFWRMDLGDTYLIESIEARLAYETAGSNALIVQGANEADYSDAVTIATIPVTATGSFTAQNISDSWNPSAVYRYWQLVQTTEDDIRIHTVELFAPAEFTGAHEELTGRDAADQHPADAVSFTPAGTIAATNVQDAIEEVAAEASGSFDPDEMLPWHVSIIPQVWTPDATTGTWILATTTQQVTFPFYAPGSASNSGTAVVWQNGTGTAQNDAAAWDVILAAGTWDAHFWVRKHSAAAIITLNQDGGSMGTVDTYDAAGAAAKVSITGWTVSTTGKHQMQVKAATKNASSSNYFISLFGIEFRRTA